MYSTRSPSLKAPATRAVLLVSHGQPSDPRPAEERLSGFAERVRMEVPDWQVESATLALPDRLEQAMSRLPAGTRVYPLFMSDGWFVRTALPRRLGERPAQVLPPLGFEPSLPGAVARHLDAVLTDKGWQAAETDLLVASHGSARSRFSQKATESFAAALRRNTGFATIRIGYVEQAPNLQDVAQTCARQALCLPFFFAEGGHVREDVDTALAESGFSGERLTPIENMPFAPALIAQAVNGIALCKNMPTA